MAGVSLKIVLVYSDQSSARLGAEVTNSLRKKLGRDFVVAQSNWKTELLRNQKLRVIAAREALDSDIVIVATSEGVPLDSDLTGWFKLWQNRQRETPGAFVALLNAQESRGGDGESVEKRLAKLAKKAHMEFFCHAARPQPKEAGMRGGAAGRDWSALMGADK